MKAKIYLQAQNAMQSGQRQPKWLLVFMPQSAGFIDPLMGWTGMTDTISEVNLSFATKEEAIDYAAKNHIAYEITEMLNAPKAIKPKSYSANFAFKKID